MPFTRTELSSSTVAIWKRSSSTSETQTKITAVISENFNAVELLGLRELMMTHDIRRIQEYEKVWRKIQRGTEVPEIRPPLSSGGGNQTAELRRQRFWCP